MRAKAWLAVTATVALVATGCGGKQTQGSAPAAGGQTACEAADGRITIATRQHHLAQGQAKLIDITPQLDALKRVDPVYDRGVIPAAIYGQPADVPTIEVPNLLAVRNDFPFGNACALTKLIFDERADLEEVHPAAKQIDKHTATKTDPVPLHSGAKQALG
jgi:TRAP transporter TAXI family solute receptor